MSLSCRRSVVVIASSWCRCHRVVAVSSLLHCRGVVVVLLLLCCCSVVVAVLLSWCRCCRGVIIVAVSLSLSLCRCHCHVVAVSLPSHHHHVVSCCHRRMVHTGVLNRGQVHIASPGTLQPWLVSTGDEGQVECTYFLENTDGRTSVGPACVSSRGLVSRLGVQGQVTLPEWKRCTRGRGVVSERGKRESERGMCEWGSWAAAAAHAWHE